MDSGKLSPASGAFRSPRAKDRPTTRRGLLAGWAGAVGCLGAAGLAPCALAATHGLADIRIRDPFVLADASSTTYYLYAQTGNRLSSDGAPRGVEVYTSKNLTAWDDPKPVFTVPKDFWARQMVWAPEVHAYAGKYYLFVTFTASETLPGVCYNPGRPLYKRGTQILVADSPLGPFRAFHNRAHTPAEWSALDGTFWEEDGVPWMVFCHEWAQIQDGTIELVQLKGDLSEVAGTPVTLFHARDANWVQSVTPKDKPAGYVTDGPFLHRTRNGDLLMIWSSFGSGGYALAIAESKSRKIRGPWALKPDPLFYEDGGHGMIFRAFDGRLMLALHQPNKSPRERAKFFELEDAGDTLRVRH